MSSTASRCPRNDIVLTAGGMHALNLCINILTKPGDIVLIESPTMFPVFTALEHRGLRAIEIPYSPRHGLDPDQFEYLTDRHDIRACVLMPAHQFPTGVSTPESAVRRIVETARRKNLPIIENGGYMDLQYGKACAPDAEALRRSGSRSAGRQLFQHACAGLRHRLAGAGALPRKNYADEVRQQS